MTTEPKFGELMDDSEEELDKRLDSMSIEDPMLILVLMQRDYISRQNATDDTMLANFISIGLVAYTILLSLAFFNFEAYGWRIEYTIIGALALLAIVIGVIFILYFAVQILRKTVLNVKRRLLRKNQK